ncbi:acyl-CoA dehydrogenase [Candidimonas sp. SYP-B2681]|uniref:acyl-CoA dehydrogenase family protein n=1 Tax=Candidimonas sp. SYP-B2681 TaxID=2497686 RepID=UPI000F898A8F|nr:acyl-CoA dehydrogenase family protein [Candidimonas sp. SYP-B2681]RTZ45808.1 acyl-CoA dehydrogenase [Candidimonas sp. SYP-B2681]
MNAPDWLDWPFFDDRHRDLAAQVQIWCTQMIGTMDHSDTDAACRRLVIELGKAGLLSVAVPEGPNGNWGGRWADIDSRSVCILRETLARHNGLADFAFAMQGLGSGAISLAGSQALRENYLPRVASGEAIAAFALSEADAGSDVAAMSCEARADGDGYVLNGEKTWISNGGIADFYCVFARTGEAPGARGISAFVIDSDTPGLTISERINVIAPHPLATLRFHNCRVAASHRLGQPGQGFKLAMMTLDIFRASVAAAALGFARHALELALGRAKSRRMFGQTLADLQLTQAALGDMACEIDAAALLTYRAAWLRDVKGMRTTSVAAMAKMAATESAQRIIDRALQMFGGAGVVSGAPIETLYREIRALRIYEGATEVQKLIIGRELLKQGESP